MQDGGMRPTMDECKLFTVFLIAFDISTSASLTTTISQMLYCVLDMQIIWGQNGQLHFIAILRQEYTFNFSNFQPMDSAASLYKTKYISENIFVQGLCFTLPYRFMDFILGKLKTHKIKLRTRS